MKNTRDKVEKVISHHKIEDTNLAHVSERFLEDIMFLIEAEKIEFKKQMKEEIRFMLNGFKKSRFS